MNRAILLAAGALAALPAMAAAQTAPGETSDEIIITATRSARPLRDTPASVSVITAQTIAAIPAKSLDEILRRTPSIDLPNASAYQLHPTAASVSMRGLGGIRALVMVDGVPINDPFFGYVQWSRVPLEEIDRVEIVRGGGATLWGNYAMGGVINVLTRQPTETELILQGGGGGYGTYRADAYGALALSDKVRLGLNIGANGTDGYMQVAPDQRGPIDAPTSFKAHTAGLTGDFKLAPGLTARARVNYFDDDQNLITHLQTNAQRTWTYAGSLTQTFAGGGALALTGFGSDSDFRTDNAGTPAGFAANEAEFVQNRHFTPARDIGASLVWSQPVHEGWLRAYAFGADFHRIAGQDTAYIFSETGALERTDIGRGKQAFAGAFAQASVKPLARLEILASVRYQHFLNYDAFDGSPGGLGDAPDRSDSSVDPRISVRYAVNPVFALRAAGYTAFRAPTLDNLYRAFSVPQGIFQGNAQLRPERLQGGEAGFDIVTRRLRLQATAYTNTIENLITSRNLDFSELPAGFFFGTRNINAGRARSRGAEIEADWTIGAGFSTALGYTFADSKITENDLDPASVGKQIGGAPRNRASLSVTYASPRGWRVTPQLRWLEASYADNAHTLPVDAQTVADLSASYSWSPAIETYLQIENLFDSRYIADNSGFNPPLLGTPFTAFAGVRVKLHRGALR